MGDTRYLTITIHLTALAILAACYGAHPLAHPVACVFAGFSVLVLLRVFFRRAPNERRT